MKKGFILIFAILSILLCGNVSAMDSVKFKGGPGYPGPPDAPGPPGNQGPPGLRSAFCSVIVSETGGHFTSIQSAIDTLEASSDTPCTIIIKPGEYTENIIIDKSHVQLLGAGYERTTILPADITQPTIELDNVVDVKISGLSLIGTGSVGIYSLGSSAIIMDNNISYLTSGWLNNPAGIYCLESNIVVNGNLFSENDMAIYIERSTGDINKNTFIRNGGNRHPSILIESSQIYISENEFRKGGEVSVAMPSGPNGYTRATISHNTFIDLYKAIDNNADRDNSFTKIVGNLITRDESQVLEYGVISRGLSIITENIIEYCHIGIHNSADQATIANNILRKTGGAGGAAISSSGTSTITGNSIENNLGHGVNIIGGIATVNGNSFINNEGYGVHSVGTAFIMGNVFINNDLGCINDDANAVGANLCNNNVLAITGTIGSEQDLNINTGKSLKIFTGLDILIDTGRDLVIDANQNIPITANGDISASAKNTTVSSTSDTIINSGLDTTINSNNNTEINANYDIGTRIYDTKIKLYNDISLKAEDGNVKIKGEPIIEN